MAGIQEAGEFELQRAELLTSEGIFVDILTSIVELSNTESIDNRSIVGTIALSDNLSLATLGPIIGQEYLVLKISTPSIDDSDSIIDFTENIFHVNRVVQRESMGAGTTINILEFTTSEIVHNFRNLISRSLKGTHSDIVTDILKNDLSCKKNLFIEESIGVKKYISPNIRPFDIIGLLTREAVSVKNKSPTFVFFENLRGYHFRTVESMYASGIIFQYTEGTAGQSPNASDPKNKSNIGQKLLNSLQKILEYQILESSDSLSSSLVGSLSSNLLVHDIISKTTTTHNYNYFKNRSEEKHINSWFGLDDNPIFNDVKVDNQGRTISDFSSVQFLTPTSENPNTGSDSQFSTYTDEGGENYPFSSVKSENWLQKRRSYMLTLDTSYNISIVVNGTTLVSVGDCVELVLRTKTGQDQGKTTDRFFQGPFLVRTIEHTFDMGQRKHIMNMLLQKDSVLDGFTNESDHVEPKPTKNGDIFTNTNLYT